MLSVAPALVLALAQLGLFGLPGGAPPPHNVPAAQLPSRVDAQTLAHQSLVRWHQALAAARYRRDDPEVAALADALTQPLLHLWNDSPDTRPVLLEALEQIAGAGLGPLAESAPYLFLPVWLRRAGDHDVLVAPSHGLRAAEALRPTAPERAAEHLRAFVPPITAHWGAWCALVVTLPPALRDPLADRLAHDPPPAHDVTAACQLLRALSPRLRPALVAQLRDPAAPDPVPSPPGRRPLPSGLTLHGLRSPWADPNPVWPLVAAFGLLQTPEADLGSRTLRTALAPDRVTPNLWSRLGEALEPILPLLDPSLPGQGRALRTVLAEGRNPNAAPLVYGLLARNDDWVAPWALGVLRGPLGREHDLPAALLLAGCLTPDTPAARRPLDEALGSLRATLGPYALRSVSAAQIDLWREALVAVAACRTDACLHDLLRHGSDEAAARAAVRLGPGALASLPAEVARDVVARVVESPGDSALAAVLLTRLRGCPEGLRGLLEYRRELGVLPREPRPALWRWREALGRRCGPRSPR